MNFLKLKELYEALVRENNSFIIDENNELITLAYANHDIYCYQKYKTNVEGAIEKYNVIRLSQYKAQLSIDSKKIDNDTLHRIQKVFKPTYDEWLATYLKSKYLGITWASIEPSFTLFLKKNEILKIQKFMNIKTVAELTHKEKDKADYHSVISAFR